MRLRAVALACAFLSAGAAAAQTITAARFTDPTDRYGHAVLGDAIEWGALEIDTASGETLRFTLPMDHVFEDVAPRLWDVTGDGRPEVVVVETDMARGGALAVYSIDGKRAETPHIGQTNRWLAPVGAADLDGDGRIEIAYIDRPHLAKTLRVWRLSGDTLTEVAAASGLTNHRIGEVDIAGGIRTCNGAPEMVLAAGSWSALRAVRFDGTTFTAQDLGRDTSRPAFGRALACAE